MHLTNEWTAPKWGPALQRMGRTRVTGSGSCCVLLCARKVGHLHGRRPRCWMILHRRCLSGTRLFWRLFLCLCAQSEHLSCLHLLRAASQGFFEIVQLLLDRGAVINAAAADNTLPLHAAAFRGHLTVVQLLLDRGAAVDGVPALPMQFTTVTPLHHAASQGHMDVAQMLLKRGAYVNGLPADVTGMTPLHAAAFAGHKDIVQLLVDWGAEVNPIAVDHSMPLHFAAGQGHADMVQQLLMLGAEVEATTLTGNTPLLAAAAAGKLESAEVLMGHLSNHVHTLRVEYGQQLMAAATAAHKHSHGSTFAVIVRELGRYSSEDVVHLYQELGMPPELLSSMLAVVLGWCHHTDTFHRREADLRRKQHELIVQHKSMQQLLVQSALNMRTAQQLQEQVDREEQPAVAPLPAGADGGNDSEGLGVSGGVLYRLLLSVSVLTVLFLGVISHV